jgi:hypothetical protein
VPQVDIPLIAVAEDMGSLCQEDREEGESAYLQVYSKRMLRDFSMKVSR